MENYLEERRFTFVDVETPNSGNNSICAIGIIHMEEDVVKFEKDYLVNPEARFDNRNMEIHGITPRMIDQSPTFPEIWAEIKDYFVNGIVVAHNAAFDLSVISKTLMTYDIAIPEFNYICTLQKARKHISKSNTVGYKLNELCATFNIDLAIHHNAMCDTIACKEIFVNFVESFGLYDSDVNVYAYSMSNTDTSKKSVVHKAINTIYGIIYGIGCDRKIKKEEYQAIYDWMVEYKDLIINPELKECFALLQEVLSDEYITYTEYNSLVECFRIYKSSNIYSDNTLAMQVLMGIIKGIEADNEVNTEEAKELLKWMEINKVLRGNYPFDKIFETLEQVLKNSIIDKDEEQMLLEIFTQFTDPSKASCEDIDLHGKTCCLTGNFNNGTKFDIEAFIAFKGGTCVPGVIKSVDYLIVGGQGSGDWKYGNYGGKVNKAIQMQEKGSCIQIVDEEVLYRK